MTEVRLMFVHALSPVHVGTGQSVGAIELPIARDRATGHPYVPASAIKGVLRSRSMAASRPDTVAVYGPETANASDHAGAAIFGDANLLLLPVRSIAGTFAWVTSRLLLERFQRDCREAGVAAPTLPPAPAKVGACLVSGTSVLEVGSGPAKKVIFEDLDFTPDQGATKTVDELAAILATDLFPDEAKPGADQTWSNSLQGRLCVVHDDVMSFLSVHATDVVARVALDTDKKTVREGPWHEENLPTETVLVSIVAASPNAGTKTNGGSLDALGVLTAIGDVAKTPVQLGGKATVGRGRCRLVLTPAIRSGRAQETP